MRYRDMIFQAKYEIENMDGARRFESCDDEGVVEVELSDGTFTSIYLQPIEQLVAVLRGLPKPNPAA
jgi:hypothetical protein